jgi:hypothetical protein
VSAKEYDYRNCQSLFGYAAAVHARSGGICQLCGAGSEDVDFDQGRQLTVEHLIGDSQGGYLRQISTALDVRLPDWTADMRAVVARRIDEANTITACSFCNATTSRNRAPMTMQEAINRAPAGMADGVVDHVRTCLDGILSSKRRDVGWKLASVRNAFESTIAPCLADRRASVGGGLDAIDTEEVITLVERIRSASCAAGLS